MNTGTTAAQQIAVHVESSSTSWSVPVVAALIGALTAAISTWVLARRKRSWQDARDEINDRRQNERDALTRNLSTVRAVDETLVEVQRRIDDVADRPETVGRWTFARAAWEDGQVRLSPWLPTFELEQRFQVIGAVLLELEDQEESGTLKKSSLPRRAAQRSIVNARVSLAHWSRGDELPPASFPSSREFLRLLEAEEDEPWSIKGPLDLWLKEHASSPWRTDDSLPRRNGVRRGGSAFRNGCRTPMTRWCATTSSVQKSTAGAILTRSAPKLIC